MVGGQRIGPGVTGDTSMTFEPAKGNRKPGRATGEEGLDSEDHIDVGGGV